MLSDSMRGGSLYDEVGEISPLMTKSDRVAAQKLREAGIPGIKYLDGEQPCWLARAPATMWCSMTT